MDLFNSINRRKSCRKYKTEPLSDAQLSEIEAAIKSFEPLYSNIPLTHRYAEETTGLFRVEAPHHMIISGKGMSGEQENAGFIFEQLMLWLDANEIGSVWLGKTRDVKKKHSSKDIIALALGITDEPMHRLESEFKRKPIEEITNDPDDECIKAVHLAPSGMNFQPWYFEKTKDKIIVYRQILKPPMSLVYNLTSIDMGIALCHYAVASKHYGKPFDFQPKSNAPKKVGFRLFGEILL